MATRSTTPPSSLAVLAPTNSLKRALSEDLDSDDDDLPDSKKIKLKSENNTPQAKDKKKRRKKKKKTPVVVPLELPANAPSAPPTPTALKSVMDSGKGKRKAALQVEPESGEERPSEVAQSSRPPVPDAEDEDQSATIARLNNQLKSQSLLLKKHETTLTQFNQSLTCQVCLDLLHKPYALAPCGHIACYNCLVAWFTSVPDEPHHYAPRRKTCPNCRATIRERPVEVWNIKDMVAALLKSGLLPGLSATAPPPPALPGPPQPAGAQPDPWHNIFRYPHQHPMFQPPPPGGHAEFGVEDMGMLDAEDGVYRCLDCMHEVWDGVCTGCQRAYAGHAHGHHFDEDDEDDESGYGGGGEMFGEESDDGDGALDPMFWPHFLPVGAIPGLIGGAPVGTHWWGVAEDSEGEDDEDDDEALERAIREAEEEDGYDSFIDDDEDDGAPRAAAIVEIEDSDEDGDGEGRSSPPVGGHTRRAAPARVVISSDEDEDGDVPSRPASRRRTRTTRISSPVSGAESSSVVVLSSDDEGAIPGLRHNRSRSRNRSTTVYEEDLSDSRGNSEAEEDGDEDGEVEPFQSYAPGRARGTAAMSAGDLVHLMARFEGGSDGDGDDDEDGDGGDGGHWGDGDGDGEEDGHSQDGYGGYDSDDAYY